MRDQRYIDDPNFPELPSDGSDRVRILKASSFNNQIDKKGIQAVDAAASILYHYNPESLRAFLDSNVESITFLSKQPGEATLKIHRELDTVKVGFLNAEEKEWGDSCVVYGIHQAGIYTDYRRDQTLVHTILLQAEDKVFGKHYRFQNEIQDALVESLLDRELESWYEEVTYWQEPYLG